MIRKFENFVTEKNDNLDPYGEEDWNDDEFKKEVNLSKELKCCGEDPMLVRDWQYGQLIDGILQEYFEGKNFDQLDQFLNDFDNGDDYDDIDDEPDDG